MRRLGAHCLVVAMKRGNARGAKGVGHQRWIGSTGVGSTGSGRNPIINGRRQPSHGGTSRMMREYHVRICEGLGVQLPGSTRHYRRLDDVRGMSAYPPKAVFARRQAAGTGPAQTRPGATIAVRVHVRARRAPFTTAGWRKMVARLGVPAKRCAGCCDGRDTPAGYACRCPGWQVESRRRAEHVRVGLEAKRALHRIVAHAL